MKIKEKKNGVETKKCLPQVNQKKKWLNAKFVEIEFFIESMNPFWGGFLFYIHGKKNFWDVKTRNS